MVTDEPGGGRTWSRMAGCSFTALAAWLLFTLIVLVGVSLNALPVVGPWFVVSIVVALTLRVARWLRVSLVLAAIVGFVSAAFWGILAAGSSGGLALFGVLVVLSLMGAFSALWAWLKLRSMHR